jgi:hypothetical protein
MAKANNNVNYISPRKFANLKNSPPMKRNSSHIVKEPTFIQLTPPNKKPISNQDNNTKNTRSKSPQSKSGGFGTLDPLLAAVFLAGVRMSMNQKNKASSSLSAKKTMRSKRSTK